MQPPNTAALVKWITSKDHKYFRSAAIQARTVLNIVRKKMYVANLLIGDSSHFRDTIDTLARATWKHETLGMLWLVKWQVLWAAQGTTTAAACCCPWPPYDLHFQQIPVQSFPPFRTEASTSEDEYWNNITYITLHCIHDSVYCISYMNLYVWAQVEAIIAQVSLADAGSTYNICSPFDMRRDSFPLNLL